MVLWLWWCDYCQTWAAADADVEELDAADSCRWYKNECEDRKYQSEHLEHTQVWFCDSGDVYCQTLASLAVKLTDCIYQWYKCEDTKYEASISSIRAYGLWLVMWVLVKPGEISASNRLCSIAPGDTNECEDRTYESHQLLVFTRLGFHDKNPLTLRDRRLCI